MIIGAIVVALLGAGGWFAFSRLVAPPPIPVEQDISVVDETAGWKVYVGEGDGIKFRLRYPPRLETQKEEFDFITHIIANDFSLYEHTAHKDDGMSIAIYNSEEETIPVLYFSKDTTFEFGAVDLLSRLAFGRRALLAAARQRRRFGFVAGGQDSVPAAAAYSGDGRQRHQDLLARSRAVVAADDLVRPAVRV